MNGCIAVDLDGTLAYYDEWRGLNHIGKPIPAMVERVKSWLASGMKVKIFTARVHQLDLRSEEGIEFVRTLAKWLKDAGLPMLDVTCIKSFDIIEFWDDRAIQVIPNTGKTLEEMYGKKR